MEIQERERDVDGIPVLVVEPKRAPMRLVLWQTHLGGSKERMAPQLRRLAEAGCRAVSFDPPEHGARARGEDPRLFGAEVLGSFRRRMWPLLGQSTIEALRVLDAVTDPLIVSVTAGGISMGGDIALALAGIDTRIERVAVVGSTPDWTRPGMTAIDDPTTILEQGPADAYGQWLRDQLDPMLHLDRYRRAMDIVMHCGGEDHHVPEANARAFQTALGAAGDMVAVTRHPGLDHFAVCLDEDALTASLTALAGAEC